MRCRSTSTWLEAASPSHALMQITSLRLLFANFTFLDTAIWPISGDSM